MNNPSKYFGRASVLPCIVLSLSALNLCIGPKCVFAPGIYVSIVGLLAVVLYAFEISYYFSVIVLWALLQLVVVRHSGMPLSVFAAGNVWDATQCIRLSVYFPVTFANGLQVGLSVVALLLLVLVIALRPKKVLGSYLTFSAYRYNEPGIGFPLKGRAERSVTLSGEADWLLVNLVAPFVYNNNTIWHVLIKRNDKQPLVKNQSNQLVFFKPVVDVNKVTNKENNKLDFEDEVWALCK